MRQAHTHTHSNAFIIRFKYDFIWNKYLQVKRNYNAAMSKKYNKKNDKPNQKNCIYMI